MLSFATLSSWVPWVFKDFAENHKSTPLVMVNKASLKDSLYLMLLPKFQVHISYLNNEKTKQCNITFVDHEECYRFSETLGSSKSTSFFVWFTLYLRSFYVFVFHVVSNSGNIPFSNTRTSETRSVIQYFLIKFFRPT